MIDHCVLIKLISGEDGEETSAAGQNETFLGEIGLNEVGYNHKTLLAMTASN